MTVITVHNLTKAYRNVLAVDHLDFEAASGRVTGFLGPNGSGKTTTLRILTGLTAPTGGSATIGGVRYRDLAHPTRTVGVALDADCFHPGRSATQHLRVLARASGLNRHRVNEVLAMVGLSEAAGRRVGTFSLGMRQRLTLAAALLGDPAVLILDEPLNGLDPEGIRWMRALLRQLAGQGRTILLSSHLLVEAAQTVDDVVIVANGRLVAAGALDDLRGQSAMTRIRTLQPQLVLEAFRAAGIGARLLANDLIEAQAVDPTIVARVTANSGALILELSHDQNNLEQLFFDLTAHTDHERCPS